MPSAAVLGWVAERVDTSAVTWRRRLLGGTHALTDVVQTAEEQPMVLRRFPAGDDAVRRECVVLAALDGVDGLAPRLVAADASGVQTGQPVIVTTMLPGRACITPKSPGAFAAGLGRALAQVHAQDVRVELPHVMPAPTAALDGDPAASGSSRTAWDRLAGAPRVLTHHDFWSGNTLWHGAALSGIVDWSGAGLAPRGFDLSWARLDLVLLFDRAAADAFTTAYEAAADTLVPDVGSWDVYAAGKASADVETWAPNYQELGRTDLDPAALRQRLEAWLETLHNDS